MGIRSFIHRLTAPSPLRSAPAGEYKLALLVNHELKMGKGKIGAQTGHASVKSVLNLGKDDPSRLDAWLTSGQAKICLKVDDEATILSLIKSAKSMGIPTVIVRDAGRTQIPSNSLTVAAIGPALVDDIDKITEHLKLL